MPMLNVGATRMSPPRRCASCAMISGQSQSVPSRPVGPCCSLEPIGMTTVLQRRSHTSISGQVDKARIMEYLSLVGSWSTRHRVYCDLAQMKLQIEFSVGGIGPLGAASM